MIVQSPAGLAKNRRVRIPALVAVAVAIVGSTGTVYRMAERVPVVAESPAPAVVFTAAYPMQQQLLLRPAGTCELAVDLDEPRVNADPTVADVALHSCEGHPTLVFSAGTEVSVTADPGATASDCADSIRTGALGGAARVPVQPRTALCVATSGIAAAQDGITAKIVLVVVRAVAADGTVVLAVSAWNAPH